MTCFLLVAACDGSRRAFIGSRQRHLKTPPVAAAAATPKITDAAATTAVQATSAITANSKSSVSAAVKSDMHALFALLKMTKGTKDKPDDWDKKPDYEDFKPHCVHHARSVARRFDRSYTDVQLETNL